MDPAQYAPPVSQLLTQGDPFDVEDWSDYLKLGFTAEHVPALIEMIQDDTLYQSEEEVCWAPVHAWRILGQLQAETAIEPLVRSLAKRGQDERWWEWVYEELPDIFAQIGVKAIQPLAEFVASEPVNDGGEDHHDYDNTKGCAIESIERIVKWHPESRADCVQALTKLLERLTDNSCVVNGFLAIALVHLQAVESAELLEQAFALDCVDLAFVGDWEDVQVFLGLKEPDPNRRNKRFSFERIGNSNNSEPSAGGFSGKSDPRTKAKRKQQKQARRQNRRKKK